MSMVGERFDLASALIKDATVLLNEVQGNARDYTTDAMTVALRVAELQVSIAMAHIALGDYPLPKPEPVE